MFKTLQHTSTSLLAICVATTFFAQQAMADGTMTALGDLAGGFFYSRADAVSGDSNVIVGHSNSINGGEAFRWTQAGGMVGLGDLAGGSFYSSANAVNGDGSVIVGYSNSVNGNEAFRWTQAGGMVGLGDLAGGAFESNAYGVNSDGTVVVGLGSSANGIEAFRWTQAGGMVGLGDLAGGSFDSRANAVSGDGSVIVGYSNSVNGNEAFRWTQAGGMVGLGDLAGGAFNSRASAVSGDGSVIVGRGRSASGFHAFRWTQETGMVSVEDWLNDAGVDTSHFTNFNEAQSISEDGTIIVGMADSASGTEAFLARVSSVGSGVLNVASSTQSIQNISVVTDINASGLNLSLFGAHHHPLMMVQEDMDHCMWVSADAAQTEIGEESYILNQEVGVCNAYMNDKLYVGFGLGLNQANHKGYLGADQKLRGQYGLVEVNYRHSKSSLIFGVIGIYGRADADIERTYLNAGSNDTSEGETAVDSMAVKLSVNWPEFTHVGDIAVSPKASYTASRTDIGSYTETGGGFPARFDERTINNQQVRVGVDLEKTFNDDKTTFRTIIEGVHRFDTTGDGVSGELIGINTFSNDIAQGNNNWGRIGIEIDHKFTEDKRLMFTGFGSTDGGDPDLTAAVNFRFAL